MKWLEFYKDKIEEKSLGKVISMMKNVSAPLSTLKIQDLIFNANHFLFPGNGVYIFYDKAGVPLYVGKCSSRSFVERIPAHFDLREEAWFNSFLKEYKNARHSTDTNYKKSAKQIFKDCSMSLLNIPNPKSKIINKMESLLRATAHPELNPTKRKIDSQKELKNLLRN